MLRELILSLAHHHVVLRALLKQLLLMRHQPYKFYQLVLYALMIHYYLPQQEQIVIVGLQVIQQIQYMFTMLEIIL